MTHFPAEAGFFYFVLLLMFPDVDYASLRSYIWENSSALSLAYDWLEASLNHDEDKIAGLHRATHDAIYTCVGRYLFEPIGPLEQQP
jgi:hypothetical protein